MVAICVLVYILFKTRTRKVHRNLTNETRQTVSFLYCLKFMKFGQLTLIKIIKNVAIRCKIFRPKFRKIDFGWGSVPDPTSGDYHTLQVA